ncbi:unnamed protein product, partial [marine sediment metagenome]
MANDFSTDPNCVALWKFDNNALDSKGGNDLTPVNTPTYDAGDKKEGTHSIDLEESSSQYGAIADGDLDAGFPGKSGTSEQSFSICGWVKLESLSTAALICKLNPTGDLKCFSVSITYNGTIDFLIGYNNGADSTDLLFGTNLTTGIWYHIAVVYDHTDNSMK